MRRTHLAVHGLLLVAAFGASGCAFIGPKSIRSGRAAYNEAITATNNEQVLGMIVRMRYGEASGLLAVSSVTANLKIQGNAGSEFGFGSETDYQGNLVPLSVGFAYEDNPTISYTPVQGQAYLRALLSPLPIDLTVLLLRSLRDGPLGMNLLVRSVNGIRNPDFLADPSVAPDPRFERLVTLLVAMSRQGHITWVSGDDGRKDYRLALSGEGETFGSQTRELYEVLGFAPPGARGGVVTIPVRLGFGKPSEPAIQLETRSIFDIVSIAAASVDVPPEHLASGLAPPLPPSGAAGRSIQIARTKSRPGDAVVSIQHHGWWYSIGGTDAASKLAFRIMESLISVRIADTVDHGRSTPVLTVPVAR